MQTNNRATLYLLWTVLVGLNAVFSFYVALGEFHIPLDRAGIAMGVVTFIVFYAELDYHYCSENNVSLHRLLIIGAVLKSLTQCLPVIELIVGAVSISIASSVLNKTPFFSTYLITLLDGIILSLVLGLILLLVRLVFRRMSKYQFKNQWLNRIITI